MESIVTTIKNFFEVPFRKQTYLNMLYLLLALPLGVFYLLFLGTGFFVGIPLIILWIGIPIVIFVFAGWYEICKMERRMAINLLGVKILPLSNQDFRGKSLLQKLGSMAANPVTWKGLLFLLAKMPMGIISFTLLVLGFSLSIALLTAPLYYQTFHPIIDLSIGGTGWISDFEISTLDGALVLTVIGIFVSLISMHINNGFAWISAKFARIMLGNYEKPSPFHSPQQEKLGSEPV